MTYFQIAPHVVWNQLHDQIALLHTTQEYYFSLDAVGGCVWQALQQPATIDQLVTAVQAVYAVDEARCRADVERLVNELVSEGLVVSRDECSDGLAS